MFKRFTVPSREVVGRATGEAQALGDNEIGTGHLLLALLDERAGPVGELLRSAGVRHAAVRDGLRRRAAATPLLDARDADALRSVGIDLDAVLTRMTESFGADALADGPRVKRRGGTRMSKAAKNSLAHALHEAVARRDDHLGPEHLLLGMLDEDGCAALALLADAGVDVPRLRQDLVARLDKAA